MTSSPAAFAPTDSARADDDRFDLIVIGAGGGGMAAALFGAIRGCRVLLLEATEYVGGTTAFSGGTTWIPNTHLAATVGADDSVERARAYLTAVIGPYLNAPLLEAFLRNGPKAIERLERSSDVKFRAFAMHPDYESDVEGAVVRGRALEPLPFDGRLLGAAFSLIRPPIPEFTVLGGMMIDRQDIGHLMNMKRSWASFRYSTALLVRHVRDRISNPRGTRLVMGNALVARLLYSLRARDVAVWTNARVSTIRRATTGFDVTVTRDGRPRTLRASRGVILATGGFNRNEKLRRERLGDIAPYSPTAPGTTGGGIELAAELGGRMGDDGFEPVLWAPVSVRKRADGTMAVFPHFIMDRGKPGTMVVDQQGRRFMNETLSYHRFGHAMRVAHANAPSIPAYLVADHQALQKYGLGMIRPGTRDLSAFVADGYVVGGNTLAELATKLGIAPDALVQSAGEIERYSADGVDRAFGRGSTIYQRNIGDPAVTPNPTLGPLRHSPFYALRLFPGDIGASSGLVTDANANVVDAANRPIPGLYAVGNDMHSVMGGTYPGPGITIGPAITFAYVGVEHALAASASGITNAEYVAAR